MWAICCLGKISLRHLFTMTDYLAHLSPPVLNAPPPIPYQASSASKAKRPATSAENAIKSSPSSSPLSNSFASPPQTVSRPPPAHAARKKPSVFNPALSCLNAVAVDTIQRVTDGLGSAAVRRCMRVTSAMMMRKNIRMSGRTA